MLVLALLGASALSGCHDMSDITGSIGPAPGPMPTDPAALREYADALGKRFDSKPGDKTISIAYSKALRALGRSHEAAAVMQAAAVKAPSDFDVLGEYGRALADDGQLAQAKDVMTRSYAPERPDWRDLSVQGTIEDRLDNHEAAQNFYRQALQIQPNDAATLSNLGLSQALSKDLSGAERTLRRAAEAPGADEQVRNNLALVLALEGKFDESQKVAEQDLSPQAAAENVATIKQMIAQNATWRDLQAKGPKARHGKPPMALPQGAGAQTDLPSRADAAPDAPT